MKKPIIKATFCQSITRIRKNMSNLKADFLVSVILLFLLGSVLVGVSITQGQQSSLIASPLQETQRSFIAVLNGANEVPPTGSNATGMANFTLSANGTSVHYVVQVSNIVNASASHIHTGAAGVNGGVVVLLFPVPPATAKTGPFSGTLAEGDFTVANLTGSLAGQTLSTLITMMSNGSAYVNVHTTQFPGGEIRGQIANVTAQRSFVATLNGANEVPPTGSNATGMANFTLSSDGASVHYLVQVSNIVNASASHIHTGAPGVNGGVVVLLFPVPPATAKVGSFSGTLAEGDFTVANLSGTLAGQPLSTLLAMMTNGTTYGNVHTTQFPGGEIRGQIVNQTVTPTPTPSPSPTPTPTTSPSPTPTPSPPPTQPPIVLPGPLAASTFSSVTIFAGQYWYFYVNSNGGVIPHKYQWYEGNTLLPGQTDMVIKATQSTPGVYTYYCKVTDAIGNTANSSSVILTVK